MRIKNPNFKTDAHKVITKRLVVIDALGIYNKELFSVLVF